MGVGIVELAIIVLLLIPTLMGLVGGVAIVVYLLLRRGKDDNEQE